MTIQLARTVTLLALAAVAMSALPVVVASPAHAAQNPTSCSATTSVVDGGFEDPAIPVGGIALFDDVDVPGWQTTATDGKFEFWGNGFNGVPSAEGNGFVELNANQVSTLYQDLPTTPGTTLKWSLQHRGRSGVDTLRVLIGDPAGALIPSGPDLSDGNAAWGGHTATYIVPPGQTTTRFAFESVSAAGGDPTFGNFLDAVSFGTAPCLIVAKSVQNLAHRTSALAGDTLRYTVKVSNRGGIDAMLTSVTDTLPADLVYLPGSLVITAGPGAGGLTDAMGDDAGDYDPATRQLRVRVGTGADAALGGSLAAGTSVTFRFDATPTTVTAPRTIRNTAFASYVDPITASVLASRSQTVLVAAAAELSATGGTISPLPLPIALAMIALGTALVVLRPRGTSRHRA
jgi:uncharacterized repeat protein (TIGR01451 family)